MSQLYDALKRVESKRMSQTHNGGDDLEVQSISDDPAGAKPLPLTRVSSSHDNADSKERLARIRVTNWSPDPNIMLSFSAGESVNGTEDFRALRSRLHQLREQNTLRSVLVASAVSGEGRSFTAANLAQAMACQQGCRTLLLDADFRRPSLHHALGAPARPGLSEHLLGEADDSEIIQSGQIENLYFVAAGRPVSRQTELLSNGRLKLFLAKAVSLFDWIILDSTALTPVSDSGLIASYCDGTLLVVRCNSTHFDVVRKAQEKLRRERILGVVLNEIRSRANGNNKDHQEKVSDFGKGRNRNLPSSEPPIGGVAQSG